jgi:hypothetical protein
MTPGCSGTVHIYTQRVHRIQRRNVHNIKILNQSFKNLKTVLIMLLKSVGIEWAGKMPVSLHIK